MTIYTATSVETWTDAFDYGYGLLGFQWADERYGVEGLEIDLEGHCSRNMPIRSGGGTFDFVALQRDRIQIRFSPELANKLELDREVEVRFDVDDDAYRGVEQFVAEFKRWRDGSD